MFYYTKQRDTFICSRLHKLRKQCNCDVGSQDAITNDNKMLKYGLLSSVYLLLSLNAIAQLPAMKGGDVYTDSIAN